MGLIWGKAERREGRGEENREEGPNVPELGEPCLLFLVTE